MNFRIAIKNYAFLFSLVQEKESVTIKQCSYFSAIITVLDTLSVYTIRTNDDLYMFVFQNVLASALVDWLVGLWFIRAHEMDANS